ncbi:hypothetical protein CP532_6602 [Ophiocordyceps camponoti-leonardi (nom. inval.)]|nr:hypothetical protein CP532_6602 [Ophiocordyceps camponoti-leonardi (nom. inval.)]
MHSFQILGCMTIAFGMLDTVSCVPVAGSNTSVVNIRRPRSMEKSMMPLLADEASTCRYPDGRARICRRDEHPLVSNMTIGVVAKEEEVPAERQLTKEDKELKEMLIKDQKKYREDKEKEKEKNPQEEEEPLPELLPVEEVNYNCTFRSVNRAEVKCWFLILCTGEIVERWSELLLHEPWKEETKTLHVEKNFQTGDRHLVYDPKTIGIREKLAHTWNDGNDCTFQLNGNQTLEPKMVNSTRGRHPIAWHVERTCSTTFPCHLSLRDEMVKNT